MHYRCFRCISRSLLRLDLLVYRSETPREAPNLWWWRARLRVPSALVAQVETLPVGKSTSTQKGRDRGRAPASSCSSRGGWGDLQLWCVAISQALTSTFVSWHCFCFGIKLPPLNLNLQRFQKETYWRLAQPPHFSSKLFSSLSDSSSPFMVTGRPRAWMSHTDVQADIFRPFSRGDLWAMCRPGA